MASLRNTIIITFPGAPTPIPAKTATAVGAILRIPSLAPPTPHLFPSANRTLKPPNANPVQKYLYPDPSPEFAAAETKKFRTELLNKLSREKDTFGNDVQKVVDVCTEIFDEFLNKDYGGPGTLLIEPFTDMMIAVKEKNLPGAPLAARASLLWAQNHLDEDWENWRSRSEK